MVLEKDRGVLVWDKRDRSLARPDAPLTNAMPLVEHNAVNGATLSLNGGVRSVDLGRVEAHAPSGQALIDFAQNQIILHAQGRKVTSDGGGPGNADSYFFFYLAEAPWLVAMAFFPRLAGPFVVVGERINMGFRPINRHSLI